VGILVSAAEILGFPQPAAAMAGGAMQALLTRQLAELDSI
jgi:hypothetical protein